MKADECRAIRDHLEHIFGEPFGECTFHSEDDPDSHCLNEGGCNNLWIKHKPNKSGLGFSNVIRIENDGAKLTFFFYEEEAEISVVVNLADPNSDQMIKRILDAELRY